MIEKEFAPYEEALALKELGFDEPCLGFYNHQKLLILMAQEEELEISTYQNSWVPLGMQYASPTYSQAFRWFRENYKLEPEILSDMMGYVCSIVDRNKPLKTSLSPSNLFQTYEEAELACLKKLIELANEEPTNSKGIS